MGDDGQLMKPLLWLLSFAWCLMLTNSSQGEAELQCSHSVTFLTGGGGVGGAVRTMLGGVIQCHLPSFWSRCFWKQGPLSPVTRSPAALLRVLHRPDQSQRAEPRVLVGCWWVGYNSSPQRDEALSQSLHSPTSPLLCAEKGFSCFTTVWVMVWLKTTVCWCIGGGLITRSVFNN